MKNKLLLFLILFSFIGYSQNPSRFPNGVQITGGQPTVTSVNFLTATDAVTGLQNKIDPVNLPLSTASINALDLKTENSAGAIQGFAVTNNGNGTVNIATGTAYLRATNDQYAPLLKFTIPAVTNLALTDNANNFVLVDYNGGSPALTVTTNTATINTETNSIAIVISRVGTTLDYLSLVGQNNDANAKIRIRFLNQEGIRRANGAVIGFANRNLTLTAGTLFSGLIRINSPAFNTASPDTFTYVYNNGSVWTRVTAQTQVNNTQYNNSGTLTTMPNNTFRTDYVYLLPNNPSKLYVVYGNTTYANITTARNAPIPSSLPSELQVLGLLVGRQIIEKNAVAISEVSSAFSDVFTGVGVPEHNALAGLQGGTTNDYQHLTTVEKNDIVNKTTNQTIGGLKSFTSGIEEKGLDYATTTERTGIPNDTEQGYAFDGTYHYLIGINVIRKYDLSWNLILSNTNILSGIPGANHTGDGVCLGGFLYLPVETFPGTPNGKIAKFDTSTLTVSNTYDISAQNHESSGITTDGTYFYIVDYNNGTKIWKYDLVGNFISTINIAKPFTNNIQSISYYAGDFYIIEQTQVSKLSLNGLTNTFLFNSPGLITNSHRGEAIQVVSGVARILAFENLTFSSLGLFYVNLTPTTSANNVFSVDTSGLLKSKRQIINEENDAPSIVALDVYGKQSITTYTPDPLSFKLQNKSPDGTSSAVFQDNTGNKYLNVGVNNSAHTLGASYGLSGESHVRSSVASNGLVLSTVNGNTRFITGINGTEQMRMFGDSGNLVLQNGGSFTDLASKFRINGNLNAISGTASGAFLSPTLTATANNDLLIGLDVNPSFVNSSFSGVSNIGVRIISGTSNGLLVKNPLTTSYSGVAVQDDTATKSIELVFRNSVSSSGSSYGFIGEGGIRSSANAIGLFLSATSGHIRFINGTGTERGRFYSGSGNFALQAGGTFTDSGELLQVTGTGKFTGTVSGADATATTHFVTKAQSDLKAPLASPAFTGNPTAPTPTAGDNDTSIATTAFVQANSTVFQTFTPTIASGSMTFTESYYVKTGNYCTLYINGSWTAASPGTGTGGINLPAGITVRNLSAGKIVGNSVGNALSNLNVGAIAWKHSGTNNVLTFDNNQNNSGSYTYYFSSVITIECN